MNQSCGLCHINCIVWVVISKLITGSNLQVLELGQNVAAKGGFVPGSAPCGTNKSAAANTFWPYLPGPEASHQVCQFRYSTPLFHVVFVV